jgi:ADP-ribose pyrophosphatase YjhB (NUDIX family)
MEMNFCRRCGHPLTNIENHVYKCDSGHLLFANASPAVGVLFVNDAQQVLIAVRAIDPGKGRLDMPGGFCDGAETYEHALEREMKEELGITPHDYTDLEFLLSHNDQYDYKGERLPVLCGVFTANLKPGVTPHPADDVAEVTFMSYGDIDQSRIQFPSQIAGLELLHQRGVI